jgi:zinc protease
MPALEASFGRWQPGSAPAKQLASASASAGGGRKIYLVDKPDAPQSTIVATHISYPYGQPEDLALEPVMQNFGGIATSRLNRNLRLDKHWSYGASARMSEVRGQRSFLTLAPVQSDRTVDAMREVAREIGGVAGQRPLAGVEYDSIMRNMTSRLAGRFETLNALEAAALSTVNLHLPDDYWSNYASGVRALSAPQLAAAAGKFVRPDEVTWIVIGDLRKVEQGIRDLKWGEVVVLNPDGTPAR